MESGHATAAIAQVLCAGAGVRDPSGWTLRLASFRLERSDLGSAALGILTPRSASAIALVQLLSGRIKPRYGTVLILGQDVSTATGRAAVRRQVGIAGRGQRPIPAISIRRLVERAARHSGQPGADRHLLVAAILDRLALTAWAEVSLSAAPELVVRKARLAAACVHQPKLLVIDGLLDQLPPLDRTVLADVVRDLERDTAVITLSTDARTLLLVCDQVIALSDGVVTPTLAHPQGLSPQATELALAMAPTSPA